VLLASGRAIVAAVPSTGSAAKAIEKSRGGLLVEPENPEALANSLLALYEDPDKVAMLGKNGRQYAVDRYSFDQALNQYEALFYSVTASTMPKTFTLSPEKSGVEL
jgi:colanic acid biosynthesis glycosyl transferase WcaI